MNKKQTSIVCLVDMKMTHAKLILVLRHDKYRYLI